MHPDSLHAADNLKAVTVLYVLLWYLKQVLFVICIACSVINITEQKKKKRPMYFCMHFSKNTHFSDTARYVYYVTEIRLPDVLICFFLFQPIAEEQAQFDRMHQIISKPKCTCANSLMIIFTWSFLRNYHNHDQILKRLQEKADLIFFD